MANNVQAIQQMKTGTCPHGLAPGACPVCSSSGGGTLHQSDKTRKVGEMTYHECAMIGEMLKMRALAQKNHKVVLLEQAESYKNFIQQMAGFINKMVQFNKMLSNNILTKPLSMILNITAIPIMKMIQNIPNVINNITSVLNNIKEKFIDIMDKLNAIFGEAKAFIEKKISEFVSVIKSKFKELFKIFKRKNSDDEDNKIDEDKKIFNFKNILNKIIAKIYRKKNRNEYSK